MSKYFYGLKRQQLDFRDLKVSRPSLADESLPASADIIRPKMPPVYDQGQLGSCTANAIAAAIEYCLIAQQYPYPFTPARLFIYYNERLVEGTVGMDAGAELRDGLKVVNSQGVCPESDINGKHQDWWWTYSDNQIKFRLHPSQSCYKDALLHKSVKYEAVDLDANQIKTLLAAGHPVIFGISVYSSFESDSAAKTGIIPMPATSESLLGGHALLAVGYTRALPDGTTATEDYVIFRNSWADTWGDKGYGYIPMSYLTNANLASDFWTIEIMDGTWKQDHENKILGEKIDLASLEKLGDKS